MKYQIPIENSDKVRRTLDILGCMMPFAGLAPRERDVLAEYIQGYLKLKDKLSREEVFTILFGYDYTKYISEQISTDDKKASLEMVRNYVSKLRTKGLLDGRSINENVIYLFENIGNEITFSFKIKS